jgi:exosortase
MEMTQKQQKWIGLGMVSACFLVLYVLMGYASGYGTLVDGAVRFIRVSIVNTMMEDYKKDGGEWGFGYFVPLAVAGLFWFRRKELLLTEVKPAWISGGVILLIGFLVYWAGYRGEQKYFGYAAGQILVLGCILWFLGWGWFGKLFWLWVLLGMMWPWRFLIGQISAPLQMVMVEVTAVLLNLFDVGAVTSGSGMLTGSKDPVTGDFISLDVDVACSGMRSLFALVMIGLTFTFLQVREEWKRWVLMACVPVVAVLGNVVRILLLYGGSKMWGTEFAIGAGHGDMSGYHLLAGLVVFVVALVLLSFVVKILEGGSGLFKRKRVIKRSFAGGEATQQKGDQ